MRTSIAVIVAFALLAPTAVAQEAPQPREGAEYAVPLYGTLVRDYDAPDDPYAPGHRGADVAAEPGTPVRASAGGEVTFVGVVAGNRTVTVEHADDIRTSYSYLATTTVSPSDIVERGQIIGTVGDGHPDEALPPHVHLSARRGDFYFDPLWLYVGSSYSDLVELTA